MCEWCWIFSRSFESLFPSFFVVGGVCVTYCHLQGEEALRNMEAANLALKIYRWYQKKPY